MFRLVRRSARLVAAAAAAAALSAPVAASAQYFGQNKVQYRTFDFRVLRTEHFDVYFYPGEEKASRDAARMAERWYARLSRALDHTLSERTPIVLYASQPHFTQTTVLPGLLPVPLAAYFGKFAPGPGQPTPSLFPLLPWFAYACFGAAFGARLRASSASDAVIVHAALIGALVALLTSEAHGFVQRAMAAHTWSVPPLRVAFRSGLVSVLLLSGWLWTQGRRGRVLVAYGQASLRIYWAHLMVAYGVLGAPWYKRLALGEWAARVVLLLAFMWLLSQLRTRAPLPLRNEAST